MEKVVAECKMYRCTCLEPILPTADHCLICHKTSFNKIELKEHNRKCVVPASSSKPVVCKASHVLKQLKINLLDMYAALPEEALRSSKACFDRRCAWRAFVKCASTIYEKWWFWSSLSAASKISAPLKPKGKPNGKKRPNDPGSTSTSTSIGKLARRVNRKRKEPEV